LNVCSFCSESDGGVYYSTLITNYENYGCTISTHIHADHRRHHWVGWKDSEHRISSINVDGVAEVTAVPDVGVFTFAVEAEAEDAATAQQQSGETINEITAYLTSEGGVAENDIKTTGYNVYPRYEYERVECFGPDCDRERVLKGYVATQNVRVKVHDTDRAGELIAGVGSRGATNVSNLSFEVDDIEAKKEEARLLAIADAKEKAKRLADELGVRLGDVLSFHDGGGGYPAPPIAESRMARDTAGLGGAEEAFVPEISVGEDEITARVVITYEIK